MESEASEGDFIMMLAFSFAVLLFGAVVAAPPTSSKIGLAYLVFLY
jgi:hypothetical protein